MKLAIFSEAFDVKGQELEIKFSRVGHNTGNLAFFRAIKTLLGPDFIKPYYGIHPNAEQLGGYDAFLTTDLIWISENQRFEDTEKIFRNIGERPLVPISVGLQCAGYKKGFLLHEDTARLLSGMAERCVLGVRGYYTAEVLEHYGIKNIEVIGCPSLYCQKEYSFREPAGGELKTVCGFRTFWGECGRKEQEFLNYCRRGRFGFVEQTAFEIGHLELQDTRGYQEWLAEKKRLFFDMDEWSEYIRAFDFCMSMRFHGSVIAMQSGVRSLFLVSDSRTRELVEFFGLPYMEIEAFDGGKNVREYYDTADYSGFHRRYEQNRKRFFEFLGKNGLSEKTAT